MISENLLNLFHFIDFLCSNIDYFNEHNSLFDKYLKLLIKKSDLQPPKNYIEKLELQEIEEKIDAKKTAIHTKITDPIRSKAEWLGVYDASDSNSIWKLNMPAIDELKQNINPETVELVQQYEKKYLEFRERTGYRDYDCFFIFDALDDVLDNMFSFFSETGKSKLRVSKDKHRERIRALSSTTSAGAELKSVSNESKPVNEKARKLKKLLSFIDFLHANIDSFNQYNSVISELYRARTEMYQLGTHFAEVRKKKALQKEINAKWDVIDDNIMNPLKNKVAELDLFDWNRPESLSNNYLSIASILSKNFDDNELDAILKAKTQYIEFANEINTNVINLSPLLFEYLHEVMAEIARDFKEEGDEPIKNADSAVEVKEEQNTMPQVAYSPEATRENEQPIYTLEPKKPLSKHYALSFIFDCLATGVDYGSYDGKKTKLESIGASRVNGAISGNTFYKAYNKLMDTSIDFKLERDLIEFAGDNWREILIELSHEPEKLDEYLKDNKL